jgi:hypothetical protein
MYFICQKLNNGNLARRPMDSTYSSMSQASMACERIEQSLSRQHRGMKFEFVVLSEKEVGEAFPDGWK